MKYKKIFLWSLSITTLSAFILPRLGEGYGLPLNWIIYMGDEQVNSSFQLFYFKNFTNTQFNLGILVLNSIIISIILLIMFKLFTKLVEKNH